MEENTSIDYSDYRSSGALKSAISDGTIQSSTYGSMSELQTAIESVGSDTTEVTRFAATVTLEDGSTTKLMVNVPVGGVTSADALITQTGGSYGFTDVAETWSSEGTTDNVLLITPLENEMNSEIYYETAKMADNIKQTTSVGNVPIINEGFSNVGQVVTTGSVMAASEGIEVTNVAADSSSGQYGAPITYSTSEEKANVAKNLTIISINDSDSGVGARLTYEYKYVNNDGVNAYEIYVDSKGGAGQGHVGLCGKLAQTTLDILNSEDVEGKTISDLFGENIYLIENGNEHGYKIISIGTGSFDAEGNAITTAIVDAEGNIISEEEYKNLKLAFEKMGIEINEDGTISKYEREVVSQYDQVSYSSNISELNFTDDICSEKLSINFDSIEGSLLNVYNTAVNNDSSTLKKNTSGGSTATIFQGFYDIVNYATAQNANLDSIIAYESGTLIPNMANVIMDVEKYLGENAEQLPDGTSSVYEEVINLANYIGTDLTCTLNEVPNVTLSSTGSSFGIINSSDISSMLSGGELSGNLGEYFDSTIASAQNQKQEITDLISLLQSNEFSGENWDVVIEQLQVYEDALDRKILASQYMEAKYIEALTVLQNGMCGYDELDSSQRPILVEEISTLKADNDHMRSIVASQHWVIDTDPTTGKITGQHLEPSEAVVAALEAQIEQNLARIDECNAEIDAIDTLASAISAAEGLMQDAVNNYNNTFVSAIEHITVGNTTEFEAV